MSVQHGSERPGPRRRWAVPTDDAARRVESAAFLDSRRRLPQAVMSRFGGLLGYDLGTVRLHDNRASRGAVGAAGARAATLGTHIALGGPEVATGDPLAPRLLAHELAHVVQHAGGTGGPSMSGPALESDADRAATDVLAGRPVRRIAAAEGKRAAFQPIEVELITYHDGIHPTAG